MAKSKKIVEIEQIILGVLESGVLMSISQIKKELEEVHQIKISPQVLKRYLLKLKKEGKIVGKDGKAY